VERISEEDVGDAWIKGGEDTVDDEEAAERNAGFGTSKGFEEGVEGAYRCGDQGKK
jgi:hypothetical protein